MEGLLFGDRYRTVEKIAAVSDKETYRGIGPNDEPIIIKTIFLSDRNTGRFLEDIKSTRTINHPGIGRTYDFGHEGYQYWVAREYVQGNDLKAMLDGERTLRPTVVAEIGIAVCEALSAAHSRDIIHGDIKPQNIIWGNDDIIRLVDFGFGIETVAAASEREAMPELTYYISPEQVQGRQLTPATDIYSLGAVLYELTAGRVPFYSETAASIADMHIHSIAERPRVINASIPVPLEQIILKALAKDPIDRYGSAEEMKQDLERFLESQRIVARTAKKSPWPWVAGFVVAALLLLALALLLMRPQNVVPNVVGMQKPQAEQAIQNSGYVLGNITQVATTTAEPGVVISQDPAAGTELAKDSAVSIDVAEAVQQVIVPYVIGQTQSDAKTALRQAGFIVLVSQEFNQNVPIDTVVSQDPPGNSQAPTGSTVVIVVSKGPQETTTSTLPSTTTTTTKQLVEVPDVTGQSRTSATSILRAAGFLVVTEQASSDTVQKNIVISQDPATGKTAPVGSAVTIIVSTGPPGANTTTT